MKLLYCENCQDVFKLAHETRTCSCGEASGKYVDGLNAEISEGVPLGFANWSFARALRNRPDSGMGHTFEAFVIPHECPTIEEDAREAL